MKPKRQVGIAGYGAYVPRYRIKASEIARVWGGDDDGLPIEEKAVPALDEDTITMSIEAARNALKRAALDPQKLRAVWVGSESHPYAVKPSSTLVAEAIGASGAILAGDWQFACKAGTEALQAAIALVGSEMADYALAIGMDTAQGRPRDALDTPPARAAPHSSSVLKPTRSRSSKPHTRTSPIHRTFSGGLTSTIPSTEIALPGNRLTLPIRWKRRENSWN